MDKDLPSLEATLWRYSQTRKCNSDVQVDLAPVFLRKDRSLLADPVSPLDSMILDKLASIMPIKTLHCCHIRNRIWLRISMWSDWGQRLNYTPVFDAGLWRYSRASKCNVRCSGFSLHNYWLLCKQTLGGATLWIPNTITLGSFNVKPKKLGSDFIWFMIAQKKIQGWSFDWLFFFPKSYCKYLWLVKLF